MAFSDIEPGPGEGPGPEDTTSDSDLKTPVFQRIIITTMMTPIAPSIRTIGGPFVGTEEDAWTIGI
jgi:hypothetical protein